MSENSSRKPLIVGNWKMNNNITDSIKLVTALKNLIKEPLDIDVVLAPPFTALYSQSRYGYFRSSYGLNTEAGRLNSKESPRGTGSNAQNIDREARDMFLADPGCVVNHIKLMLIGICIVGLVAPLSSCANQPIFCPEIKVTFCPVK